MAERGGEPGAGFRSRRPLPLEEARAARAPGGGRGAGGLCVVLSWCKSRLLTSSKLSRRWFPQTPKLSWWPPGLNPSLRKSNALRTGKPLSGYFGWAPKANCLDAPR